MAVVSTLTDAALRKLVTPIFHAALPEAGPFALEIVSGNGFDGDPMIFITGVLPADVPAPRGAKRADLQARLAKALIERGDLRQTYLRLLHPADIEELRIAGTDSLSDA